MKTMMCVAVLLVALSPENLLAHGGGGHGGGGGHRSGGHGGGHRGGGGRHGGHGGHGGRHGHGNRGNWNHHNGAYGRHGWYGNHWYGPYNYGGWWWGAGGAFLVGLTFYTITVPAIQNNDTWVIYSDDTDTYQTWPDDPDDLSIYEVENDPDGYGYRICNGDTCVRAKPANY